MSNPLEECCPVCERKGFMHRMLRSMMFKINEKWTRVSYISYGCSDCGTDFITTEKESDPFQKAKDLGWVKG